MKITFCGAAGTTTGSQHLLEVNGQRILLDCGLYQGRRQDAYERNKNFLFDPASLHAVILSHAHIDHSGNLPNLTTSGFNGPIYSTFATRDLCSIMLPDSAKIQSYDVAWLNKHLKKSGNEPAEPLYTMQEAEMCLRQFITIGYERTIPIGDGVKLTFVDAGHILGAAQVILDIDDRETGDSKRLLFSGDIGRGNNDILRNPAHVDNVDYLIMESTYGGLEHELPANASQQLGDILNRALKSGGKVIIPAFAVERTQQLLYVIHQLLEKNQIPDIPIFVDSPLAVNATEIFRLHPECFNEKTYNFLFEKRDPFGFENLTLIRSVAKSRELNERKDPSVIISASGMCEAGRILHHLRNNIEDPKNTILFVGYCAENTLGWKIREGWNEVRIFGEPFTVRAEVEIMDSFSGHADNSELLDYFDAMGGSRKKVWLVHGEPARSEALRAELADRHGGEISVARLAEEVIF